MKRRLRSAVILSQYFKTSLRWCLCAAALIGGTRGTQDAIANGDTRSITILHMHTKEETTVTFRRDGRYDGSALEKLNWALRDWRNDEPVKMDPRLFDVAWEVHRSVGSGEPFHVVSAYRSPGTNSMLRRRSRGVAKHSQHMLGKAMDFYLPDVSSAQIRAAGMQLQRGGVGYYPSSANQFIHLDVGSVRSWPRMSRDQLARIFPTGKTVHLPADGEPLEGYELAKAEILARGGSVAGYAAADLDEGAIIASGSRSGFWSFLFGSGDEDEARPVRGRRGVVASRQANPSSQSLAYANTNADNDPMGRFNVAQASPQVQAVPLRERIAASSRRRGAEPEKPEAEETRLASLAASPASTAAQMASPAMPAKPAPAQPAVTLMNAPLPVSRPRNIAIPENVQLAALAPATPEASPMQLVAAPAPPLRPAAMASVADDAALTTATVPAPENAPALLGKLVNIAHPGPPLRPAAMQPAMSAALVALAPPSAAVPAASVSPAERDALSQLFAKSQPVKAAAKPRITTAKALAVAPRDGVMTAQDTPAASVGFSKANLNDVRTDKFTGPAVRPLPTTFIQQ